MPWPIQNDDTRRHDETGAELMTPCHGLQPLSVPVVARPSARTTSAPIAVSIAARKCFRSAKRSSRNALVGAEDPCRWRRMALPDRLSRVV